MATGAPSPRVPGLGPVRDLARAHGHRPRDRRARLRRALEQRPLLPAGRRRGGGAGGPRRPGLRGLVDPVRLGRRHQSGADGLPRLGRRVPEPGTARQDGHGPGPRDRRPSRPRPRRGLVRAGAPRVRVGVPAPWPAPRPDGGGRRDLSRAARRGVGDLRRPDGSRRSMRGTIRRPSSRGCPRHRRERREAHAPDRGRVRGHLERGPGLSRVVPPAERRSSTSIAAPSAATRRRSSGPPACPRHASARRGRRPSRPSPRSSSTRRCRTRRRCRWRRVRRSRGRSIRWSPSCADIATRGSAP